MTCLQAGPDGFVHACSVCNMENHTLDKCCYRDCVDLFKELVLNRGNKPPIYLTVDWYQLWINKACLPVRLP